MKNKVDAAALAKHHTHFYPLDSMGVFSLKMLLLIFALIGFVFVTLPLRSDLDSAISSGFFLTESFLWLCFGLSSAGVLYQSSFPEARTKPLQVLSLVILATLIIMAFFHEMPVQREFSQLFQEEFDLWRGRCGFIITILSSLSSLLLFRWSKKGASSEPQKTGLYAGFVAAGMGCFLMQFICNHSEPLHLMIWHFTPLFLIALGGQKLGRKILGW